MLGGPLLARSKAKSKPMRPPPAPEERDAGLDGGEESEEAMESEGAEQLELEVEGEEEEEEVDAQEEQDAGSEAPASEGGDAEAEAFPILEEYMGEGAPPQPPAPPRVAADYAADEPSLSSPEGSDGPPEQAGIQDMLSRRKRRHPELGDAGQRKKRRRHSRREDKAEGGMPMPDGEVGEHGEFGAQDPSSNLAKAEEEETEDRLRPETIAVLREMVTGIYSELNPTKLAEVDVLFVKYAGMEFAMYERICDKYGRRAETLASIKAKYQADQQQKQRGSTKKGAQPAALQETGLDGNTGWPFAGEPFSPNSDMSDDSAVVDPYAGLAGEAKNDPWKPPPGNNAFMPPPPGVHHPYGPPPGMPPYWPPGWPVPPGYPPNGYYGQPQGGSAWRTVTPGQTQTPPAVEKIDAQHLLGEWRDSSGHDVKVDWASPSSAMTGALLDVQLRRRGKSEEPIRLNVKRVDGRLQCGHYDLDIGKSTLRRMVWNDFNTSGKESVWER